jgi:hypothetical protein
MSLLDTIIFIFHSCIGTGWVLYALVRQLVAWFLSFVLSLDIKHLLFCSFWENELRSFLVRQTVSLIALIPVDSYLHSLLWRIVLLASLSSPCLGHQQKEGLSLHPFTYAVYILYSYMLKLIHYNLVNSICRHWCNPYPAL